MSDMQELQSVIAQAMLGAAAQECSRIEMLVNANEAVYEPYCTSFDEAGLEQSLEVPSTAVHAFIKLRKLMVTPEHGTWLSAVAIVDRDRNSFDIKYNYDREPVWHISPGPDGDIADMERFPRPYGEIPEWHAVRKQFTEQQWLAKFPQFAQ
ncbi:hypothetical protein EH165_12425 [Nakamurella antarctica]|uniref:DUF600 family protein n=1 Tax=Nakamurella antarctica TaxID=1902245 RepID=A0A3G8ZNB2_9ACTN|nr:hypothetical protein [Nakamurella antarctica]AZI58822.1 hypothetical protein EH165_12425 [Nakamurella antarctica]